MNNFDKFIEDSLWYENSKQIILILQLIFYVKNNQVFLYETTNVNQVINETVREKVLVK
ncbi:MAG: hypothetical protein Q8S84_02130 [bacterium]|nr:hypothetical protein [bacterium]